MNCVPPLQLLHGRTNRQGRGIPLAQDMVALVIEHELGMAGALAIQKLLPALLVNDLATHQSTIDPHRNDEEALPVLDPDIGLFLRETLGLEVRMLGKLALLQDRGGGGGGGHLNGVGNQGAGGSGGSGIIIIAYPS